MNSPKRPGTGLCWSVPTSWVNIVVSLGPQIHCTWAASAVPTLRILHLQKCKLSTYCTSVYCMLCIYIAGMFVYTFDFVKAGKHTNEHKPRRKKIQKKMTVLWDRFQKCWQKVTDLGLHKGRDRVSNFLEAPLIFKWHVTSSSQIKLKVHTNSLCYPINLSMNWLCACKYWYTTTTDCWCTTSPRRISTYWTTVNTKILWSVHAETTPTFLPWYQYYANSE